ncbi:MAG: hypothetical protein JXR10_02360 [Cyclobacteriaceae bacterium]
MRVVIIIIPILLFYGCAPEQLCATKDEIATSDVRIEVQRLEEELFAERSLEGVTSFLADNQTFTRVFLNSDQYPSEEILASKLNRLLANEAIDTLYQEAKAEYEGFDLIVNDLEGAIGKIQTLFPDTKTPKIQTTVTGLYNDLFISDSLIIVGLDFFIGQNASYKPLEIPGYVLRRYNKEHLAAIIIKFMAGYHTQTGTEETLLSEMIDFGKTYYLTRRLLPCTPDSILLGYTADELQLAEENEHIIWATLLQNEALYETNHIMKKRFLGERPNVHEISQKCPGRIGAWVGWQIVESYMSNNDVEIRALLGEADNEKIFRQSGYKPKSR